MNMQEFAEKRIKSAKVERATWDNPLRIINDGFRYSLDVNLFLIFKHRSDSDLCLFYTKKNTSEGVGTDRFVDGLRYVRRRMSYTHEALQSTDGLSAWMNGGIRARLRNVDRADAEFYFKRHVSVYKFLREFMGDEIFMEFLGVREGDQTDGEDD